MGESKIRKCIICGQLITASRRYAYCSDECAGYASKERARAKMREIQEEHRKFITETRQKKNMTCFFRFLPITMFWIFPGSAIHHKLHRSLIALSLFSRSFLVSILSLHFLAVEHPYILTVAHTMLSCFRCYSYELISVLL